MNPQTLILMLYLIIILLIANNMVNVYLHCKTKINAKFNVEYDILKHPCKYR